MGIRNEETCSREDSFAKSLEYAQNNALWLQDFAAIWTKLVTHNQPELLRVDANDFVDTRDSVNIPSEPPILITREPSIPVSPVAVTPSPAAVPTTHPTSDALLFCCVPKRTRIPHKDGRCWGAETEGIAMQNYLREGDVNGTPTDAELKLG